MLVVSCGMMFLVMCSEIQIASRCDCDNVEWVSSHESRQMKVKDQSFFAGTSMGLVVVIIAGEKIL